MARRSPVRTEVPTGLPRGAMIGIARIADPHISNTGSANPIQVLAVGYDTLALTYRPAGYGRWMGRHRDALEAGRARARGGEAVDVTIGGQIMRLQGTGAPHYAFRLLCSDFVLLLAADEIAAFPPVMVWIRAEGTWGLGPGVAVGIIRDLLSVEFGSWGEEKVSRADLTFDFTGYVPDSRIVYLLVTRAKSRAVYWEGERISGLSVGSGQKLLARLYDKSLEILSSGKHWMKEVWLGGGWDGCGSVWRLEFEIKRDFLREWGVEGFDDLQAVYPDICRYLLEDWLRLQTPEGNVHPLWDAIRAAVEGEMVGLFRGSRGLSVDTRRYVYGVLGYLTSFAAARGISNMDKAWKAMAVEIDRYLRQTGETFELRVARKRLPRVMVSSNGIA